MLYCQTKQIGKRKSTYLAPYKAVNSRSLLGHEGLPADVTFMSMLIREARRKAGNMEITVAKCCILERPREIQTLAA